MITAGCIAFILIGLILGLMGGGGSILGIPVLVYVMGFDAEQSSTYSLFIIGVASLIGTFDYLRKGNISLEAIFQFALASIVGVFCVRKFVMPIIPETITVFGFDILKHTLMMVTFSILIIVSSISMIKKQRSNRVSDTKWNAFSNSPLGLPLMILLGVLVGFITGFVGAGGGFMIVPVLIHFLRLDLKKAIGTSLCIIALNSLIGFTGNVGNQSIDWLVLGSITVCCVIGLILGSLVSNKIASQTLKSAFGWFTLVIGFFIFIKETLV